MPEGTSCSYQNKSEPRALAAMESYFDLGLKESSNTSAKKNGLTIAFIKRP